MLGAFIRDLEARIAEEEAAADGAAGGDGNDADEADGATGSDDTSGPDAATSRKGKRAIPVAGDGPADELRDALRLGRLLLGGVEVTL